MTKEWLKKTGEWYLYHHYKNENNLFYTIIISCIVVFFNNGILFAISIWFYYLCCCAANNRKLDEDPDTIKERESWMKFHEKKGDVEEYKRILGIK